jgi:hypothetical protein
MTWLSANAGTILVLLILVVVVGLVIWKMISDRRKGITACDSCVSADACSIHAAGKSCGNPHDRVADMEPQVKKVR